MRWAQSAAAEVTDRTRRGPSLASGRKDLQDPDRDVTEPGHPVPEDEQGQSGRDAGAEGPVQLEIPATEQRVARE
jgi:hypothetical protein